jgi:Ca-activated chloride channel family protein
MRIAAFLICILFSFPLFAQIEINVEVVNVYVSVTDAKDRFIKDLKPEDFVVKEDGAEQKVTHFSNFAEEKSDKLGEKGVPLTIAFVMDTSESMGMSVTSQPKIDIVKSAAFRVMDELRPEDQMLLISFNKIPTEVTPLTSDKKKFSQDLLFQGVDGGNTALLDSIYFALEKIKNQFGRKIIIVCSDGEDTASYLTLEEVLSNVIASDVTILAFGTMELGSSSLRGRYVLEEMARASGGYAFFPTNLNSLKEVMDKLRQSMRSQYSLGYTPAKGSDGTWRKIEVLSKRPGVKLRYRSGYYAK